MFLKFMELKQNRLGLSDYFRSDSAPVGICVCENPKFIYMKPAKTAGTSILRYGLEKRLPNLFNRKDHPEKYAQWLQNITDEDLKDYFIFSVVRNPFDRIVSVATYFQIPFKDFIFNFDKYCQEPKIKTHALPLSIYTHLRGVPFVDRICRLECLQADMNLVFDQLGLDREKIAFVNQSKSRHYSSFYTEPEMIKLVESLYSEDIKNFGYMFETQVETNNLFLSRLKKRASRLKKLFA